MSKILPGHLVQNLPPDRNIQLSYILTALCSRRVLICRPWGHLFSQKDQLNPNMSYKAFNMHAPTESLPIGRLNTGTDLAKRGPFKGTGMHLLQRGGSTLQEFDPIASLKLRVQ